MQARILALALSLGAAAHAQPAVPGAAPLTAQGDLALRMVDGINQFLLDKTAESLQSRDQFWKRDYRSVEDYVRSVSGNREEFRRNIGAVDARARIQALRLEATTASPALVGETSLYRIFAVNWPVLDGVTGEGLLLEPKAPIVARVVAIPDADVSPEMLAGLVPGIAPEAQFARRLAENGCLVVVPLLIDRGDIWSGNPGLHMTNQPHREFIYRMAFQVGRHIIGYEVQKVLAVVDWFTRESASHPAPIAVFGHGEGGLLALYSGALDTRIDATVVSGYFQSRQEVWKEPLYRDVWDLLRKFGDAELAGLIAPRTLIVEASRGPEVSGPPPETKERDNAAPSGVLRTPPLESVRQEVARARPIFSKLTASDKLQLVVSGGGSGPPGSNATLEALLRSLGRRAELRASEKPAQDVRRDFDAPERLHQQFRQLIAYTQKLVEESPKRRAEFWSKADSSSVERWKETTKFYRDYVWDEVIGRLPNPSVPPNPRARLIYDEPKFRGYEVMLDVWPGVFAYGILNIPKDIRPGERRPVVVCQHGLEGRAVNVASPRFTRANDTYQRHFGARLAELGFVTFSPQNPYIGDDRFRLIQRKAHPLKLALFSVIVGQHQRILEWLSGLPFVDGDRIGFYGISYGGKTAIRVPPLLERYALSICSADFNEWIWKTTSIDFRAAYPLTKEYEVVEFNVANVANHAEMAGLMAPRPFMVERGHDDGVAPDEWVAYEYAKVRRLYEFNLRLPDKTEIEFFNGPHTINGVGTFDFLRRQLHWPN